MNKIHFYILLFNLFNIITTSSLPTTNSSITYSPTSSRNEKYYSIITYLSISLGGIIVLICIGGPCYIYFYYIRSNNRIVPEDKSINIREKIIDKYKLTRWVKKKKIQPIINETDEITIDEITIDESTIDESTTDESTTDESTTDESTTDESTTDESTTDESTTDDSTTDESTVSIRKIRNIYPFCLKKIPTENYDIDPDIENNIELKTIMPFFI